MTDLDAQAHELIGLRDALKEARDRLLDAHKNGYTRANDLFPRINTLLALHPQPDTSDKGERHDQ